MIRKYQCMKCFMRFKTLNELINHDKYHVLKNKKADESVQIKLVFSDEC